MAFILAAGEYDRKFVVWDRLVRTARHAHHGSGIRFSHFISIICCLLLLSTGCAEKEAPPMPIGMNVWPGYEPLFLARHEGNLPAGQFRLVEFSDASEVARAFRNGT
ncbi:MAG TPA: hypothetical protein VF988_09290, partial [Verrucomicrobiae bacterium]